MAVPAQMEQLGKNTAGLEEEMNHEQGFFGVKLKYLSNQLGSGSIHFAGDGLFGGLPGSKQTTG